MLDSPYVYCVMDSSGQERPIENRIFSTWQKADQYRKELREKNPHNPSLYFLYVEMLEID